jgi:hypothetical protein
VYKALKNQMAAIHEELKRMESISPDNDELLYCYSLVYLNQNPQFFSKLNKVWDILI